MKRIGLVLVVTGWVAVSGAFAAPVGSGGRLYYTVTDYRDVADNVTRLFRVDVDSNWDNLTAGTQIATVANEYGLLGGTSTTYDRQHRSCTSPEILHPRKYGGDGSVFLASYVDNSTHTRYHKVMPDGTVTVLHPGEGVDPTSGSGTGYPPRTGGSTAASYLVDNKGDATGRADTITCWGADRGANAWYDMNSNDDLTDNGDVWVYPGYHYNQTAYDDAEVGGYVSDSSKDDTIWYHGSYTMAYRRYTGDNVNHTWAGAVNFYDYRWYTNESNIRFLWRGNGIAVGDTDNDGYTDVYALTTDAQGSAHNGASIFRLADLTGDGTIDDNENDLVGLVYDDDMLAGTANNLGGADLELVQDDNSGKWTLLVLLRGSSWSAQDGRIIAMELSDNGYFAGGDDAFKEVLAGIETGGPYTTNPRYVVYGLEFDADPLEAGPIPGDSNGDGKVDGGDLAIWQQNYDPLGTGNNTFALGDWNGDGKIDGGDLALWQQNYDPIGPTGADGMGANVPEPATLLLLGSGLLGAFGIARRRRLS